MKCIICNSKCSYYFSKEYLEKPYNSFMKDIGKVEYYKCNNCGFVISKTHKELDDKEWNLLNHKFHDYLENSSFAKNINQPPYIEQAMMISFLGNSGLIDNENMLDYAAGYGRLSKLLFKYHNINLPIFDPYIQDKDSSNTKYLKREDLKKYEVVINSAMFEHILKRDDLEQVNSLVSSDGCLIVHTVICENVPRDPNWFYLDPPVHTAFHTNSSMQILMDQWGYRSSIYCPNSKCWVLLKSSFSSVEGKIEQLNQELNIRWFYCKNGFMDYWKGF